MLLFTKPIPRPAIWGGTLLREYFHYPDFPEGIGQSWSFSAQEGNGKSNVIVGGPFDGKTLLTVWQQSPELFQSRWNRFPVIISLVAPEDDLSIQIHPNDAIAAEAGYSSGKNEAWYFLEAQEGASIVYGQRTKNLAQLRQLIMQDRWQDIIEYMPVRQGDFVYLPAGMLHALKKGSVVYEIQQATDVTYRFFDYHRKDAQGQERPLQLEQAIHCVDFSLTQNAVHRPMHVMASNAISITEFIKNESFCVRKYEVNGTEAMHFDHYELLTCVAGEGTLNGNSVHIGESCLVTVDSTVGFTGNMVIMSTAEV